MTDSHLYPDQQNPAFIHINVQILTSVHSPPWLCMLRAPQVHLFQSEGGEWIGNRGEWAMDINKIWFSRCRQMKSPLVGSVQTGGVWKDNRALGGLGRRQEQSPGFLNRETRCLCRGFRRLESHLGWLQRGVIESENAGGAQLQVPIAWLHRLLAVTMIGATVGKAQNNYFQASWD